jgi:hypothetical protein
MPNRIPSFGAKLADIRNGLITREWFRFLSDLAAGTRNVTPVTVSPYQVSAQEVAPLLLCDLTVAGPVSVVLAASVPLGTSVTVKDGKGNASVDAITVTVDGGGTIDGAASSVLSVDDDSRTFVFTGAEYKVIK